VDTITSDVSSELTTLSAAAKRTGHDVRTLALALQGKIEPDGHLVTPKEERIALYERQRVEDLAKALLDAAKAQS
jgi:hypothetical protein